MFNIVKPGTKYDFLGKAPVFTKVSALLFIGAILVIALKGVNLGLDFAGGHQILLEFEQKVSSEQVRSELNKLFKGVDTSVQSYEVPTEPDKTYYLTRIERSETLSPEQVSAMEGAFKSEYSDKLVRFRYNPEAGDVVELDFASGATNAVDLSTAKLAGVVTGLGHEVGNVRQVGRLDPPVFRIVLRGVDVAVVKAMKTLDPNVRAPNVEFVGPTVGKQLRNDGILAVLYALLCILIYIALRFDFFYSPGAILCLFHDAIITVALLSLLGAEFTLATIAGILTLVGYSINDTIVVFDRIRETAQKVKGSALKEILNRAINETLARTIMTSVSTLAACVCLIVFGRDTVLASFGLIMTVGIIIGTYSSIYVASPAFMFLKERFGEREHPGEKKARRKPAAA